MLRKVMLPRWLLYLLYGLVLTGILLYTRFPADQVEAFLLQKVEGAVPGSSCSYTTLHYSFPFSMIIEELHLTRQRDGSELLLLEDLVLTPAAAGLGRSFTFTAALYEGAATGRLNIMPLAGRFSLTDVQVERANMEQVDYLQSGLQRDIKGLLSGAGVYEGSWVRGEPRSGRGNVELNAGSMLLRQPILSVGQLDFEQLAMTLTYGDDELKVVNGKLKGSPFNTDFSGEVKVRNEVPAWQINLAGTIRIDRDFIKDKPHLLRAYRGLAKQYGKGDALPYGVSGSVGTPRFRFGGE